MDHGEAVSRMDAYFRGELDRATTRDLHQHFNACEECKVLLRSTRASLHAPSLKARGTQGVQGEDRLQEILRRNRTITYVVVVILLCFFFFFRMKQL